MEDNIKMDVIEISLYVCKMDGTDSELCPVAAFDIGDVFCYKRVS
jgi:hypothetical protein